MSRKRPEGANPHTVSLYTCFFRTSCPGLNVAPGPGVPSVPHRCVPQQFGTLSAPCTQLPVGRASISLAPAPAALLHAGSGGQNACLSAVRCRPMGRFNSQEDEMSSGNPQL